MDGKKKIGALIASVGLIGILLVSMLGFGASPMALPENLQPTGKVPGTDIPGVVYTGDYIRIGLNKGGTFGVGKAEVNPGTGFQYPIGPQYESLAIWWWGEGYSVSYKVSKAGVWVDKVAYWWPDLGWPPPAASGIVPVSATELRNDDNRAEYSVKVQTVDKALNMTFRFFFPKDQKYVLLETTITNNGAAGVRDVVYKRIVDWDIQQYTGNTWTNDAHSAYASYWNATEERNFEMSVSGYSRNTALWDPILGYVDLYAWDDMATRGPGSVDIQSHNLPLSFDGCAAIYYDVGWVNARESKYTVTVYQAGWNWAAPPA